MQNTKKFVAIVVYCLLLSARCTDANMQAGNTTTEFVTTNAHGNSESELPVHKGVKLSENFKKLLSGSSSEHSVLDLLNDSSEVNDGDARDTDIALKFDDFVPRKELAISLDAANKALDNNFMNVFKVPKGKTKKTQSIRHASIKNEPVINDFNSELLFAVNSGNLTDYDSYFHAFTHLFDHSRWNVNSFSLDITKACLNDIQVYLNDLSLSIDWAVKVNDASGKYRGLFFFENSFWLGSLQYCNEIDGEYNGKIPELQFFVLKVLIKLEPVNKKVSAKSHCHYHVL
jgi:hypothetical protein